MTKLTRPLLSATSLLTILTLLVFTPNSVAAATSPLVITADSVITGAELSEYKIYSEPLAKGSYTVKVSATRESLDRPRTNVIVTSGNQKVTVANVQTKGFKEKSADKKITSDGNVRIAIQFGPDKVFSGGLKIELARADAPTAAKSTNPTPSKPIAATPSSLPQTGIGTVTSLAAVLAVAAIGYTIHSTRTRRSLLQ